VHGANRLASNSLMECLVFARQLRQIEQPPALMPLNASHRPISGLPVPTGEQFRQLERTLQELRSLCWQVAGVERQGSQLRQGLKRMQPLRQQIQQDHWLETITAIPPSQCTNLDTTECAWISRAHDLRQRLVVTQLLLEAALFRQESRGGHFRVDAPAAQPFWQRHSVQRRHQPISTEAVAPLS
jgi:L-aspartate oxidase